MHSYFLLVLLAAKSALSLQVEGRLSRRGALCSFVRGSSFVASAAFIEPPSAQAKDSAEGLLSASANWLVNHPAPQFLVNNRVKRWVTEKSAGSYDKDVASAKLREILDIHDVVVFSESFDIAFSATVKHVLAEQAVEFFEVPVDKVDSGGALVVEIGKMTGRTSIPAVFIAGKYVGGCNDGNPGVRALIASGMLEAALEQCSDEFKARRKVLLEKRRRVS